jgi:hypothetical protein
MVLSEATLGNRDQKSRPSICWLARSGFVMQPGQPHSDPPVQHRANRASRTRKSLMDWLLVKIKKIWANNGADLSSIPRDSGLY